MRALRQSTRSASSRLTFAAVVVLAECANLGGCGEVYLGGDAGSGNDAAADSSHDAEGDVASSGGSSGSKGGTSSGGSSGFSASSGGTTSSGGSSSGGDVDAGTCMPGSPQCLGAALQTCNASGAWQTTQTCPYACSAGRCTGTCTPGATQCSASTVQTCDASGAWQTQTACAGATPVCANGQCVGVSDAGVTGVAIGAGGQHTCVVMSDGTVQCWGDDVDGQLGNGGSPGTIVVTPVTVSGISTATAVAGGDSHTCALLAGGTVECWGNNAYGQLGNGGSASSPTPVQVIGVTGATAITAGGWHSCAVVSGGAVQCWGDSSTTPVTVSGLSGAVALAAGFDHTCALLAGGTVACWGYNSSGQLGIGSTGAPSTVPATVVNLAGAIAVTSGAQHSCALLSSGAIACWGSDIDGQLGASGLDAGTKAWPTPVQVSGLAGATGVAAGESHTCGLVSGGQVECWGYNWYGELGIGTTVQQPAPVQVPGLSGVRAIASGAFHTCALLSTGAVQCWGDNYWGELGDGTSVTSDSPQAVTCHGGACGPCTPVCGACSASCASPACCGASCQPVHSTGVGQTFYDCAPLGTYDWAHAMSACLANYAGNCKDFSFDCGGDSGSSGMVCDCGGPWPPPVAYCWEYSGARPGAVLTNLNACPPTTCPTTSAGTWN